MFNGKHVRGQRAKKLGTKITLMVIALSLVVCCVVGGTLAWLVDETQQVTNTFTYGNIDITLDEAKVDQNGNGVAENGDNVTDRTTEGNTYKMIPGSAYWKDPTVTVLANSEPCYLFVKVEEKGGVVTTADGTTTAFKDFLDYGIAEGWTLLDNNPGVYYRIVKQMDYDQTYGVLNGDKVTVNKTVTKSMIDALEDAEGAQDPELVFTGYAIQSVNIADPATAWTEILAANA